MRPIYKKVKALMPHCPICQEQFKGDGSGLQPYKCKCGEWKYSYHTGEYELREAKTNDQQ